MKLFSTTATFALVIAALAGPSSGLANPQDFIVQSVTGTNVFKLSDAKGKFVALHFLLKTECPYCLRHTQEYLQKAASVPGVVHVFLKPDTEEEIKAWAGKLPAELSRFPVYRDPEARLAEAFEIPGGYRFHGQEMHYPALVLLNTVGKEAFRYVGRSNGDRYSFAKFTAKMAELRPSKSADR